jgi:hypothetical protein
MANETQRVLSEKAKGQSITELGLVVNMQSFSLGDQQCNPSTYLVYACLGDTGGRIGIGWPMKHNVCCQKKQKANPLLSWGWWLTILRYPSVLQDLLYFESPEARPN